MTETIPGLLARAQARLTLTRDPTDEALIRDLRDALLRSMPPLEGDRLVMVSRELLPQLTADWSEPVRVKITEDDGRTLTLVFQREYR